MRGRAFWQGIGVGFLAGLFVSRQYSAVTSNKKDGGGGGGVCDCPSNHLPMNNKEEDGWKDIHVFYGKQDILLKHGRAGWLRSNTRHKQDSYLPQALNGKGWTGQVLQDLVIYELLGSKANEAGFFVDLASNHALMHSNSYALETLHNWTGLCIDGNPYPWESLAARNCHVIGAVVGQTTMEEVLFIMPSDNTFVSRISSGGTTTTDTEPSQQQQTSSYRYTLSLTDLFQKFHVPPVIDYFSFDVENAEGLILSGDFLEHYTIKLWSVESPDQTAIRRLRQFNYVCLKRITDWGETIWAHESVLDQLDFSTAQTKLNISLQEAKSHHWTCGY